MEIHFLGTGSAYPGAKRDNTSLCLTGVSSQILIDVSGNPCLKLKQINIDLGNLDAVILTHFHIDHIYGLPSLLWGMWLENRKKPLTIYCDYRNETKLNHWLDTMEADQWAIKFPIIIKTFNGNIKENLFTKGDFKISCFPALHSVPTIGLEFMYHNKRIIYSGDSEINSHIQAYSHIDILIHEATFARKNVPNHASLRQITDFYDLDTIKNVYLVHLSDNEPYEEELNRLGMRHKIKIAEDMEHISVKNNILQG
ncbi:MBL fold metallo-hydrolase [Virgibacillus senegalensis]|uniref:MBL fold metallo-hydrolase n=1 Tax=Virgibacillus senegalensis TaxID=1499679 RepID=UPI00069F1DB0|nr:ribonuclease Z [Virgibacillus senegalensis]